MRIDGNTVRMSGNRMATLKAEIGQTRVHYDRNLNAEYCRDVSVREASHLGAHK